MTREITIEHILSTRTVRDQATRMLQHALEGHCQFTVQLEALPGVTDAVWQLTCERFPDLRVPPHSRWRHFEVHSPALGRLQNALDNLSRREACRASLDLVTVSVLLDAGAGPTWVYKPSDAARAWGRSEGLGLATLDMFLAGLFSSDRELPYQVDAAALARLVPEQLQNGFQIARNNPMAGLDGRIALMQRLGACLAAQGRGGCGRPADILLGNDWPEATPTPPAMPLQAPTLLRRLQEGLANMWPERVSIQGMNVGDVWHYPAFANEPWVPFHKLLQWLTYSSLESLQRCGVGTASEDQLTGLAEYRNGGLFLDSGVLSLRDPSLANQAHSPAAPLIVEWRALTIALLDRLGALLRERIPAAEQLSLAQILEGGTWLAGRRLAAEKRDGSPPLNIISDGTVF